MPPLRRCWGGRFSPGSDGTSQHEKPEERADGDRRKLAARALAPGGLLADKGREHGGQDRRPVRRLCSKTGCDEASDYTPLTLAGAQC
jgi:hypothetical protein